MSHQATNWAIQQRGLKPATKILLWHLADCHNPAHGCFPSQEYLADHCEMDERTVRRHLLALEDLGLIARVKVKDKGLFAHTEYTLNFSLILSPPDKMSDGQNGANPPDKMSATHRTKCPPNPVIDNPVKEHSNITPLPPKDKIAEILCEVMTEESAQAFIEHRKHKRAKLTENAARLIAKKLSGHPDPNAVIEKSIMNGWTGVFPESMKPTEGKAHGKSRNDGAAVERARRAKERQDARYAEQRRRLDQRQDRDPSQPLLSTGQPGRGV